MKIFLTLSNIVLAGLVLWAISGFLRKSSTETVYTVGRDRDAVPENRARTSAPAPAALSISDASGLVIRYNLFNISRCPDAVSGRGGGQAPQMTLVGVYRVGEAQGAIIQQRAVRGRTALPAAQQQTEKRFYQIGDVMSNGYTLSAISDAKVTLSRGGSTMELQLENAGRGITAAAASAAQTRQRPSVQQTQQFMMMGMMQQMMQQNRMMMQQQNRNQQQQQQGQIPAARQNQNRNTTRR